MSVLKGNFKLAIRTLKYNYKRYICTFVLIVMMQSFFASLITIRMNNDSYTYSYLEEKYRVENSLSDDFDNYHVILKNLSPMQEIYIKDYNVHVQEEKEYFHIVRSVKYLIKDTNFTRYDVYIYFHDNSDHSRDPISVYDSFRNSKLYSELEEEGKFDVFETPLLRYSETRIKNGLVSFLIILLSLLVGILTFTVLYSTMVNHYRFTYGIYMSFGAGFSKLVSSAMIEMAILNILSIPLGFVSSVFISSLIYPESGDLHISALIYGFLITVIVTFVSVILTIRKISLSRPSEMIKTSDNSVLISSPRKSRDISEYTFPGKLESLSLKRYRKYYIRLIFSSVIFASLFVAGIFLMKETQGTIESKKPQYELELKNSFTDTALTSGEENSITISDEYERSGIDLLYESFVKVEGVEKVVKNEYTYATETNTHVLIENDSVRLIEKGAVEPVKSYKGFFNARYMLYDEYSKSAFDYLGYDVSGDPDLLLSEEGYVIISDSFLNTKRFNVKPGDTVKIGFAKEKISPVDEVMTSKYDRMLRLYLDSYIYEYEEYTVAAVIHSAPSDECFDLYLSSYDYSGVTGKNPSFTLASIYTGSDIDFSELFEIEKNIRFIADGGNITVNDLGTSEKTYITKLKSYPAIIFYVSIVLLCVTILIWLLSQILFYNKREREFDVYFCLGADLSKMKKLFVFDAIFNILISSLTLTALSFADIYIVKIILNKVNKSAYRSEVYLPELAFIVVLVIMIILSVTSVYTAYNEYISKANQSFTGKNGNPLCEKRRKH